MAIIEPRKKGIANNENRFSQKKYQEMQNFIYNTYVKGICCYLVNKELSTSIDSPVKEEVIKQNVISADMNPFTSPVVEKLAKLFDLETKDE